MRVQKIADRNRQLRIDHGGEIGGMHPRSKLTIVIELIRWTKGFGAPNIEGRDVAAMFSQSLAELVSTPELYSLSGTFANRQLRMSKPSLSL